jgi:hypothetical protein
VVPQEVEQVFGFTPGRAEMDVGQEDRAMPDWDRLDGFG